MNSIKSDGEAAEDIAVEYLKNAGFKVVERNYKTKWYELDIIARDNKALHFVEVKYRSSRSFGLAENYITRSKLHKLKLGAQDWVSTNNWQDDWVIDVVAITGKLHQDNVVFITNVTS